jgi:hypothetical protein
MKKAFVNEAATICTYTHVENFCETTCVVELAVGLCVTYIKEEMTA